MCNFRFIFSSKDACWFLFSVLLSVAFCRQPFLQLPLRSSCGKEEWAPSPPPPAKTSPEQAGVSASQPPLSPAVLLSCVLTATLEGLDGSENNRRCMNPQEHELLVPVILFARQISAPASPVERAQGSEHEGSPVFGTAGQPFFKLNREQKPQRFR